MAGRRKKSLSDRQKCMLDFISEHYEEHGFGPTIREIGEACNISSTSVVEYNLKRLEERGYIERDSDKARSIVPRNWSNSRRLAVPIYGTIAAGTPFPHIGDTDHTEHISVGRSLLPKGADGDFFALRVKGDSMIDALVNDGDFVVCQRQVDLSTINNGDMVAAWLPLEEQSTLKYFHFNPPQQADAPTIVDDDTIQYDWDDLSAEAIVRLVPANPAYDPIVVPADALELHGRVVLVIRQYTS